MCLCSRLEVPMSFELNRLYGVLHNLVSLREKCRGRSRSQFVKCTAEIEQVKVRIERLKADS